MSTVGILDTISFTFAFTTFVILAKYWKRRLNKDFKVLLWLLLLLSLFHDMSNILEWTGVTSMFDSLEDYLQMLEPVLWFSMLYVFVTHLSHEEVKSNEENLRITLNSICDGVVSTDSARRVIQMNPVAEQLCGWKLEEAQGMELAEVFRLRCLTNHEDCWDSVFKALELAGKIYLRDDFVLQSRNGKESRISFSASPIRGNEHERSGIVLVLRDLTEELAMQEELRHRQRLDAIGQLAGGVAHDFNNVLGGIIVISDLLKRKQTDPETISYLDMILDSSTRASNLATKLLFFARRQSPGSTPVDVHKILKDTITIIGNTIDRRIRINVEENAEISTIIGDDSQLQAVFLNLAINAAHSMPEGGTLTFSTETLNLSEAFCSRNPFDLTPGKYVEVKVADTGCGISPEIQDRIFEPFFTTKEQGKGTGLGLSAAYGTIVQHKGAISVSSELGVGSCFQILLPATGEDSSKVHGGSASPLHGKGRILLIDDDMIMRVSGKALLEDYGYDVVAAENGIDGVKAFQEGSGEIDLVILDMVMPEMNGRDCFYKLKEIRKDVKVILSSGFTRDDDLQELKNSGLIGLIQKPYRGAELSQMISDVLAREV